ncbi:MAG: class I SAM-dependent methyltransferase [Acidimicrobiia bacterium]
MNDQEALWSDFLAYIERAPAAHNPAVLFAGFRDELVAEGMSKDHASDSIREIVTMATWRRDWTAPMFDRIYASPEPRFSTLPNVLLVEVTDGRLPGVALDIAMGQGRNALYLASCGWKVTGFDVSREGIAVATTEAMDRGLSIDARVAAHDEFEYGSERWDLIVMTYALVPVTEVAFAEKLVDALRPGGLIVIESFVIGADRPPRPVEIDPDQLRQAYSQLQVLRFEDAMDTSDWSDEPARIVRMAAAKN